MPHPTMSYSPVRVSSHKPPAIGGSDYWNDVIEVPVNTWIFDIEQFEKDTPSRRRNVSFEDEVSKRVKGVAYIFNCCKQLRLSRSVGLTASTIFHRFYMVDDLFTHHYYEIGATSLFIACKSEECRRNLKDLVKVCAKIASGKPDPIDEESKIYWRWKDMVVKLEESILEKLNFDVNPENPYRFTMDALGLETNTPSLVENKTTAEETKQMTELFGHCTFLFELISRLPICLFSSLNSICALVVILCSKKVNVTFPINYIKTSFHTTLEDVITCYNDVISLATEVETLDKYFRILSFIPRTSPSEIKTIFN